MVMEMGRMLLSLGVVLGLLWVIARVGRGRQASGGRALRVGSPKATAQPIEMLGRRSLGRHSAVFVIRAGNRTLVVGQTAQQITTLAECGPGAGDPADGFADSGGMHDLAGAAGAAATADTLDTPGTEDVMPGLASEYGGMPPKAWDAFVDRVREMTVRR